MAEVEADIGGYYLLMILGAIGLIAIGIYIIIEILLYLRKKARLKAEKN
ncbi:MAG: hypothetical protein ACFFDO_10230 [Candidatus Thorarchaeota archaeon]|jgi:hypothetical protein